MPKKTRAGRPDLSKIPASQGYLVVDSNKCSGCQTCMLMCSLVHDGVQNPKLARIQVLYDPFRGYPGNIKVKQCRQCIFPACMAACPTGAISVDKANGNVRRVDKSKCIGCQLCVTACLYTPSRIVWNFEEKVAQMCDLCIGAKYWDEDGGPDGKQACVEVCPMQAIKLTKEQPTQIGDFGYDVNMRGEKWPMDRSH